MNTQRLTLITGLIAILAVIGIIVYSRVQTPAAATTVSTENLSGEGQPLLGDPDATVEIIAFEDLKCPACRNFEESIFPRLEQDFIETGKAKFRFVNFAIPLGPDSVTAAIAGECVFEQDPEAFWTYKTVLYRLQGPESQRWATPSRLTDIAKEYVPEVDADALRSCIDEERYAEQVQAERAMGVAAGVTGTPSIFVNGVKVDNFSYDNISAAINTALGD